MEAKLYLDDQVLQTSKPSTCCLCEQVTRAGCTCIECGKTMCLQCHHHQAKFTATHRLQPRNLNDAPTPTRGLDLGYEEIAERQASILDAALSVMTEERRMLQQQGQAAADTISKRADTVRALLSHAEERTQRALADMVDREDNRLLEEISQARARREKLMQMTSQSDPQTVLVSDDTLLYYQQRLSKGRQSMFLIHPISELVFDPKLLEAYLGVVQYSGQGPGEKLEDGKQSLDDGEPVMLAKTLEADMLVRASSQMSHSRDMTPVSQDLANRPSMLQSESNSLRRIIDTIRRDVRKVQSKATKIQDDVSSLHTALTLLKGANSKTQPDLSLCQNPGTPASDVRDLDLLKEVEADNLRELDDKVRADLLKQGPKKKNKEHNTHVTKRHGANTPTEIGALSQMFSSLKSKARPLVAFHVRLRADRRLREKFLVKHEVRCNIGQAYDTQKGIFATPVTGVYLFLATDVKVAGAGSTGVRISVDGTRVAWAKSRYSALGAGVSCTSHVAVRLTSGQRVSLSAGCVSTVSTWLLLFSGMLMQT